MVVMAVIAAQAEQLLAIQTDRVGSAGIGQGVELTVHGGQADFRALVLQPAVQVLGRDELLTIGQSSANGVLLLGLALDMFNHGSAHAFFKSSQQPVASRSATVFTGSSVSTVM